MKSNESTPKKVIFVKIKAEEIFKPQLPFGKEDLKISNNAEFGGKGLLGVGSVIKKPKIHHQFGRELTIVNFLPKH